MERDDRRVRALVASVAGVVGEQRPSLVADIERAIVAAMPELQRDDTARLLRSSISENVAMALHVLVDAATPAVPAPAAAVDYARRLARRDVPAALLGRAYHVGQARFLDMCIDELLRQSPGEHLEGLATREMVAVASEYIDSVVEQVLSVYSESRDAWVRDRSAVLATRIRAVLRDERVDVAAVEQALDYRFDRDHQALVLWVDDDTDDAHDRIRHVTTGLGASLEPSTAALVVPYDESTAWAWFPTSSSGPLSAEVLGLATKAEPSVAVAVGEPASGIEGFRRSHRQATSARSVALAAGVDRATVTPFADVAPVAMMCTDLESARDWIHETLGGLAVEGTRNEGLRETARVFLQTGGSYTATADQLFLHRNTAQYRVRKAEELRGRPLREGRLDVELALLACHWLKAAVLRPA